ncbi:cytochrome P450 monooxygenase TRI13 [Colletotrichum spaethianum]|uniref:Cytochrome P450 monooxygenase TRI13 n=1 Tax=Colletotrichum spaethianum TaxID=700344 RepID=A0AA37LC71_9PEZI|nr:cytochrome P450 monooxygenase TRI13 [Colletotrichum spaethianum]GKT43285.1 cytochrome P450 monooxygenase TRI13 [Colletotrichum spaethianum]
MAHDISPLPLRVPPTAIVGVLVLTLCFWVVRLAYRRPLPGIPYNRDAAKRLMGDLAELGEWEKNGKGIRPWFLAQAHRHNSALTQIFLGPFAQPAVLVSDYREVNDILSHRDAVDFKRGKKVDVFSGLLPHAFPAMETFDPRFKSSRDLVRDLMAPSFLNTVNVPHVYAVACNLLELWSTKARMAKGHPFNVFNDIVEFSFDAILSAATGLGPEGGDVKRQLSHLAAVEDDGSYVVDRELEVDDLVHLPAAEQSLKLWALGVNEESLWKGFYMPWPRLYHRANKLLPSVRKAEGTLKEYMESQITAAIPRLSEGGHPESALDYTIQREMKAAEKVGREPFFRDPRILDQLSGYLIAGHDTSTGSLLWLMRRLLSHPEEQKKIRANLRETYSAAWDEKRLPTPAEIIHRSPYLDAFIEEVLRFNTPVVTIMVTTSMNTIVLGHPVPADTQVFLNLTGASINMPSVPVEEHMRSETSRTYKPARQDWDDLDPGAFRPERWLKRGEDGKLVFNAASGPTLAFSAGNRGCWGKRLGYLELRVLLTLLLWKFDFELPEKLVSWNTYDSLVTAPKECIMRVSEVYQ